MKFFSCFFIVFLLNACAISLSPKQKSLYQVEVFFADETQALRPYKTMENVFIYDEQPNKENANLSKELQKKYGKLPKGYSYDQKEYLLFQLTRKAKTMGADAIVDVSYQFYAKKDVYGYNLSGMAVKYTDNPPK